jgi:hypothetical protein
MRNKLTLGLVGLCLGAPGCSFLEKVTHGAFCHDYVVETEECPIQQSEDCLMSNRHHPEAVTSWTAYREKHPAVYSDDFAWGFKRGFAASLDGAGSTQSPPQPPQYYCQVKYETPQGYRAIEDWYSGYEQGVMAARSTDRDHNLAIESKPAVDATVGVDEVVQPVPAATQPVPEFEAQSKTSIERPEMHSVAPMPDVRGPKPVMGMIFFEGKASQKWPMPPKDLPQEAPGWQPDGDEEITHLKPSIPTQTTKGTPLSVWHSANPGDTPRPNPLQQGPKE